MFKAALKLKDKCYSYFSLNEFAKRLELDISHLPFSLKILLENIIRCYSSYDEMRAHALAIIDSVSDPKQRIEIAFLPSRVLMQDFTGVPAVVDLASMRDAVKNSGKNAQKINPLVPVDLVIDHSLQVDFSGDSSAFAKNVALEYQRNHERYEFLKWAQKSFENFRVVPPGTGICHQVNLENLAKVVWENEKDGLLYFDSLVGTDSHTTMINGLGVLGWGVGGIEAEAAMLGQPISMLIPEVIGFKLTGKLPQNVLASDLVLTITQILRKKSVVGKFVEFFGEGLSSLSLADRATIANMAPEYGATCGIFPIDQKTLDYLYLTGRSQENIDKVENYCRAQGVFLESNSSQAQFSEVIELDLNSVVPSLAGPKRPQDRVILSEVAKSFENFATEIAIKNSSKSSAEVSEQEKHLLKENIIQGDVVIAAITSCTNTSNPAVLVAAGLLAKKAVELGLKVSPKVKTSLAPGSQVVSAYLQNSGLQKYLDSLGFNVVGYGCTTCIGNSGNLSPEIEEAIKVNNLAVGAVLSGNRNFEGRVHPLVKANYLASPPLVVAYAIAGSLKINISSEKIGISLDGKAVFLSDIWPSFEEIDEVIKKFVNREIFVEKYRDLFSGDKIWQDIKVEKSDTYNWNQQSTYIRRPTFFERSDNCKEINVTERDSKLSNCADIKSARILAIFGDSITTDHISPAGNISATSPAALYLNQQKVDKKDFNSYGARRGNHEVMMRGTFANIRIKNEAIGEKEGGFAFDSAGKIASIYDAAMSFKSKDTPLVIVAGKEYGTGSSRDWAAKGTFLLGIKAVIAESFERIHRSNLIGMGVLPLTFLPETNRKTLNLKGNERIDILGINSEIKPKQKLSCIITDNLGETREIEVSLGIYTQNEVEYFKSGGILQFVMNQIVK